MNVVLKERILPDLRRVLDELKVPVLYVTHDTEEAELLADSYAVMDNGAICSVNTSQEAFELIRSTILLQAAINHPLHWKGPGNRSLFLL